jgi:hypothetical protein
VQRIVLLVYIHILRREDLEYKTWCEISGSWSDVACMKRVGGLREALLA